jgi:hypothetical protein
MDHFTTTVVYNSDGRPVAGWSYQMPATSATEAELQLLRLDSRPVNGQLRLIVGVDGILREIALQPRHPITHVPLAESAPATQRYFATIFRYPFDRRHAAALEDEEEEALRIGRANVRQLEARDAELQRMYKERDLDIEEREKLNPMLFELRVATPRPKHFFPYPELTDDGEEEMKARRDAMYKARYDADMHGPRAYPLRVRRTPLPPSVSVIDPNYIGPARPVIGFNIPSNRVPLKSIDGTQRSGVKTDPSWSHDDEHAPPRRRVRFEDPD